MRVKESRTLEFKEEITNSFLKTVSAFSNYGGGSIVFGIRDDGSVAGLSNPEQACLDIENKINDTIHPQPDYELTVQYERKTVTLTVHAGLEKPYMYKSKAYRRNDSATIEVDKTELTRLILQGRNLNYEQLAAKEQDLSFHSLEQKAIREIGISRLNHDVLKTLDLYSGTEGFNHAAELLADRNSFPGIDIARFGNSINIILKRVTYEHMSVLDAFEQTVQIYRDYYQYEAIKGVERAMVERVPEVAFREALANALIHRTWDVSAHIRVLMFDDRIEIISPGGLPSGMTKEEYLRGSVSMLRNPILGNIFYRLHMVEILGTGILRIRGAYRNSGKHPMFEVSDNCIKVVLPVMDSLELTEDEKIVYGALSRITPKSAGEITGAVPFGRSKVAMLLKCLVDKGCVTIHGNGRGTKYSRQ